MLKQTFPEILVDIFPGTLPEILQGISPKNSWVLSIESTDYVALRNSSGLFYSELFYNYTSLN